MEPEIEAIDQYKIKYLKGFSPVISSLVCMMVQTRINTLSSVRNLSQFELDFLLDNEANSIGALLAHMAAVEKWYQAISFGEREIEGVEFDSIEAALDLGDKARNEIKGNELPFYLDELNLTREKTIREFKKRTEEWLWKEHPFSENKNANNYYLWFHVIEDEINHRGQINLIKKRIKKNSIINLSM